MHKFLAALALGAAIAATSTGAATANTPSYIATPERVSSAGPQSFQIFCAVYPNECLPGGASRISLTEDVIETISRVNARVNRAIRPQLDSPYLQVWQINPRAGDCKSYAISKRHELIKAGMPASALRIAYVKTRDNVGHAVLVIKTDQGDLALDNLTGEIRLFRETGYRLVAMSQADPRRWS